MENLPNDYSCYSYFTPNFSNRHFLEQLFLAADRKINTIYLGNLNLTISCAQNYSLEMLSLQAIFCITQELSGGGRQFSSGQIALG